MQLKLLSELFKGEWSGLTAYTIGDVVSNGGSSYACILAHTNQEPPNATYWALLAEKGDTGDTGIQGPQGEKGDQGDPGFEVGIGVLVGIGDGTEDTFTLPFTPSNPTEVILFVGGAPKFLTDDFILIDVNTKAQFITPPRNDQKIRILAQK